MKSFFKRRTKDDSPDSEIAKVVATYEFGQIIVRIDDQKLFEGILDDTGLTFIALAGILGKRKAKKLISRAL